MTTSLARQLKKLAAPQTTLLKQDKKKPSLLFDPREAASLDRDVIYEIGLSGLDELEALDSRFSEFRESLFSPSSKSFERSVQTAQINRQVDERVESFLLLVSPYFTLKAAQKALEWLVCRYHIHQFNIDAWIMAVLPFHDANLFVRAIQLLYLKDEAGKWHWLKPLQKPGIPLPKGTLLNRVSRDIGLLKLICSQLDKAKKIHSGRPSVLATFIAFFTSNIVGMLEHSENVTEEQLGTLLPTLCAGLSGGRTQEKGAHNPDLAAGCYMIVAQLTRKAKLSPRAVENLTASIVMGMPNNLTLTLEAVTVLVVLSSAQPTAIMCPSSTRWKQLVKTLTFGVRDQLIGAIETLASTYRVSPLVSALVEGFLMTTDDSLARQMTQFLELLVDKVRFQGEDSSAVIKSFVNGYLASLEQPRGPESKASLEKLVRSSLDRLERQYPVEFERALHQAIGDGNDVEKRKREVRRLFGSNWDVDHTSLYLQLNHHSTETRAEAVASVVKALSKGKVRNMSFAVSSVSERLTDSSPLVVDKVLVLGEMLMEILPADQRFPLMLAALNNGPSGDIREWHSVRYNLILLLCGPSMTSSLNADQQVDLFLAILPYLVPLNAAGLKLSRTILQSSFCSTFCPSLSSALNGVLPPESEKNPDKIVCGALQSVMSVTRPFETDALNAKLFQKILARLRDDPSVHPTWVLPALFVTPALIRAAPSAATAATQLLAALQPSLKTAKLNTLPVEEENLRAHSFLIQARTSGYLVLDAVLLAGTDALECIAMDTSAWAKMQWAGQQEDERLIFMLALFRFLASGLTSRAPKLFQSALKALFNQADELQAKIFFLSLLWNDPTTPDMLKAVALKMAAFQLAGQASWAVQFKSAVVPQLLCCLTSTSLAIRQQALAVLKILEAGSSPGKKETSFKNLVAELNRSSEEIMLDAAQIRTVLSGFLSQTSAGPTLSALLNVILSPDVPYHIKEGLLRAMEHVNSIDVLKKLLPVIDQLVDAGQVDGAVVPFNRSRSGVLTMLLERFDANTASLLVKDDGWNSFQKALGCASCFVATGEESVLLSPQDIVIEVVTKDFFRAVGSEPVQLKILTELLDIITRTERTVAGRQARRALKRCAYDAALIVKLLEFQQPSVPPAAGASTPGSGRELRSAGRRQRPTSTTTKPSQSPLWNRILAVLEMLQSKKGVDKVQLLIGPLFGLLKSCLDEEEQAPLEYSKQLILSSLLACCQKLPPGDSVKLAAEFNTGLIVQCVRVSANPQTHHQALLLLSLAAQLFPSHVLHNIMAIFTFMGTSVLRQDDAYSFQVIAKTLESVIPALIEASSRTAVEPAVTAVVHVFADALPEVPEHRRLPVFDKLLTTLDPQVYLWLAPTLILSNMATQGSRLGRIQHKVETSVAPAGPEAAGTLDTDKEKVVPDVEFSLNVCHLYKPQVQLAACIRMLEYLKSLPAEKSERRRTAAPATASHLDGMEGSTPFALEGPATTTRQLCHFKLLLVSFISTLLASNHLIEQLVELDDDEKTALEPLYKQLVEAGLEYTQVVSQMADAPPPVSQQQGANPGPRFWRVLLHRCYDVIDRTNSLLPRSMFLSVVHSLLAHTNPSVRRRAMELMSAKLQHQSAFFSLAEDEEALLKLIPDLTAIAQSKEEKTAGPVGEEAVLNQQTAFFTLKLLCRLMAPLPSHATAFRPVLDAVVNIISLPPNPKAVHVPASAFLCLAELIQDMGVQSLPALPRYGAQVVARLEADAAVLERNDLLLLSVVTAVAKLVDTLPQFLVPYLPPILKHVCHLSAKQPASNNEKLAPLAARLQSIRHSLATASVPRSLVASVTKVYGEVTGMDSPVQESVKGRPTFIPSPSIGPLMSILSESFASMSREDLTIQLPSLTTFFLKALDARSLLSSQAQQKKPSNGQTLDEMDAVEEPVVSALVALVLKLSEASFRPLFFQLYDWATRLPVDGRKERLVSFYVATLQIAEKLKGLFVAFAGHFVRNAAQVVADTNWTQTNGKLPFSGPRAESNTTRLLESVLRCLYRVCLHDNEHFINKERFETLMEPLVEQLENQLGGEEVSRQRVKTLLVPLLAQMAVAAGDDYLWKALHYQLLLKMRSNSTHVRLGALDALAALVEKLGEDYLALLPEAIPFLAELLEDDVHEVEVAAQSTISRMEDILGEPLQKYF